MGGTLAAVAAWLLLLFALPAAGSAAPFNLQIDNALLDLGSVKAIKAIEPGDPPASLTGTVSGGKVTIPKSGFRYPPKTGEITGGIDGTVEMSANREITGRFEPATGALTLAMDLKVKVTLHLPSGPAAVCVINPVKGSFSTAYGDPYLGVPFAAGLTGPGALAGHWEDLPAPTGSAICQIVGQLTKDPGGLWLAYGSAEPQKCADNPAHPGCDGSNPCANGPSSACCARQPAFAPCREGSARANLSLRVSPRTRRVRPGRTAVFTVKVKNAGGKATGARVCAAVPRRKAKPIGCLKLAVPAGKTLVRKVRVKLKPKARGKLRVRFKLTAPGLPTRSATAIIET